MSGYDYIEPGYIQDGYFFTSSLVIFEYGSNRLEISGPTRRAGTIRLLQPEEYSCGWERCGYPPIATVHTLQLEYERMRATERDALEAFRQAVDDTAGEFSYIDGETGRTITARFESPEQSYEEAGYNLYRCAVSIQSLSPFFPYPAAPPADIAAILAGFQYPYKYTVTRKQPQTWMSDGTLRIATKSPIRRTVHVLPLVRKSAADMGNLFSFFEHTAIGIRNKWSWTLDGTPRQVRFASPSLSWQQSQLRSDLVDITITLEEDA